jgi:hypothetical protein
LAAFTRCERRYIQPKKNLSGYSSMVCWDFCVVASILLITLILILFEGGIEGEGMVKDLRPLCPNAVKFHWPLNLINAYNQQNSL